MLSLKTTNSLLRRKHEENYCQDRRDLAIALSSWLNYRNGRRDAGADVLAQPLHDAIVVAQRNRQMKFGSSPKATKIHHKEKNMKKTVLNSFWPH